MPGRGVLGFFPRRWNGRNPGLPSRGPISEKKWGKNPEEEVLPSGLPSLVRSGQTLYFCLSTWPAAQRERPVTATRPPAGRAGDVGGYLWEKAERNRSVSAFFRQQTTSPARPSRGRAMRRWS